MFVGFNICNILPFQPQPWEKKGLHQVAARCQALGSDPVTCAAALHNPNLDL